MRQPNTYYKLLFLAIAFFIGAVTTSAAPTAASVLDKAASALLKAKTVTASYTVKSGGAVQKGSISVKGKKFCIACGGFGTWYDGRTLWNYNKADNEVTISAPTAQEIVTVNPYALLSSYKTLFTAKLQNSSIAGTYAITLTPKSAQNMVRHAVLYIRSSDSQPVRLDVTDRTGAKSIVVITDIRRGSKLTDSAFVFPSSRYKNVSTIDLR